MEIVLKSLVSALFTGIILVIAKFAGARLAGAIGNIPIVFAVSYVLVTMGNKSLAREFLIGGIYGAIACIFFSLVLIWLNTQFIKLHWLNFAIVYIATFLLAFLLVRFTSK